MGVSLNGYIAKTNGDSDWTSDENLQGFYDQTKNAGNIIMGRNTYLVALKYGYFPFPDALNVVVSSRDIENKWGESVMVTDSSPKEILEMLGQKGFERAFLAGGGELNTSFIKNGLIDEIYFDVEPIVIGEGIRVFKEADFEFNLELLETKNLNEDSVQLHYKVVKM